MKALAAIACLAAIALYACVLPLYGGWGEAEGKFVATGSPAVMSSPRPEEALKALASDPNVSESQRREAQRRLEEMYAWTDREADIEEALKAIGCGECDVQLGSAYACVFAQEEIVFDRAASILAVVTEISGLDPGWVRIISR